MIIDNQNNEISYTVDGNDEIKTLTLPNGVYTSATINQFWIEVTRLFNESMEYTTNQINRQWFCGIEGGRASFQLLTGTRVAPLNSASTGLYVTKNLQSGGAGGGKLQKMATSGDIGNNSYLYIKSPNNKGCSSLRATLFADNVAGTKSGFVLGYTANNPNASTVDINPADYLYGIRYVDLNQNYKYIVNGVETISDFEALLGDTLEITGYGGSLYYLLYRDATSDVELIHSVDYNHQTNLFPLLLFVGVDTIMYNIQFTSDPYYNINNTHGGEIILNANPNIVTIPTRRNPTNCFLQFNSSDLATILGYNKTRYPDSGFLFEAEPNFIADKSFSLRDYSESFIIELLNIKLQSMDSLSQGQRNFLYVIPQLSPIKEHVVYQVPQLIFLDINNNFEINLREIKARVLTDTLNKVNCYGLSQIVLIIKDKDEM